MESNKKKNRRKIKYQFNIIIKGEKYNNGCGTDQGNLVYITRALNPNHTISSKAVPLDPSGLFYMKTNDIQFQVKLALYLLFTASN